jgi:transcriptional regulator with XRE-family HTH domain
MNENVGKKIKELRSVKKLTLKDLSSKTGLSTGFLSQLERGLSTIAIDSLEIIAKELDVDLSYFFMKPKNDKKIILRDYEQEIFQITSSQFIHSHLTNDVENKELLPRFIEILPMDKSEKITAYAHKGEEFVFVLEGILTLIIDEEEKVMYPGDSAHYSSEIVHNWANYTNKKVKILVISTPNIFKKQNK